LCIDEPETDMPALLEVENAEKSYGANRVLTNLAFSIDAGENLLLLGPSGCGKSTLLRLIAGLNAPDRGLIQISGNLASRDTSIIIPPQKRGIAMVFQDLGLWPNLTSSQNVALGLAGAQLSRREKSERIAAALRLCEVAHRAKERPSRLSAGEQQRVALARAIAIRPKLLLLDEPFTGLDLILKNSLCEQISQLAAQFSTTVLMVSHNPADAAALSASLAVLEDGHIRERGALAQLLQNPQSRTLRAWASAMPANPTFPARV
jgi:ABC-type Fe3+/spermidine/putrescine transport system ATPase subunit